VEVSPGVLGISYIPLSTLIPGTIPLSVNNWAKFFPFESAYPTDSENMMTPEMCFSMSGVVNNISLYFLLFSAVLSRFMVTNFFPTVPSDSSAAKIPFPGVQIFLAVSANSCLKSFFSIV